MLEAAYILHLFQKNRKNGIATVFDDALTPGPAGLHFTLEDSGGHALGAAGRRFRESSSDPAFLAATGAWVRNTVVSGQHQQNVGLICRMTEPADRQHDTHDGGRENSVRRFSGW
ncbi:MAG: hypothetical protein ABGX07_09825 [Pirellulaceae bacterium]